MTDTDAAAPATPDWDVVIVGGGPAGLSAALNLVRARHRVLVVDGNRPRNAATLIAHGFLTRDGVPPHELRRLAREELAAYPDVEVLQRHTVSAVRRLDADAPDAAVGARFAVDLAGPGAAASVRTVSTRAVLAASGLRETLPALPSIRAYYGMSLFSCAACDGWELRDQPLALIGESDDLFARALLVSRWSSSVTVFTNGVATIDESDAAALAARGIRVDRRPIADLDGDRGTLSAVRLADGEVVPVTAGFVRPLWHPAVEYLDGLGLDTDGDGHLLTDGSGRTNAAGVYAAGDVAAPGPQQLIVAAGAGARVAAVITHDLLGVTTAH
ncbi:NAD(P)/FAD-dependent oxidoreductase [Agromyces sp. ISL-38]|uniref:NAD(P)/FAD-dependent oxidoreductase n=1 Tax=Agromyces sp. ISL-38 TaxID=2819107 RepID=UPI001BE694ED|nr:NAD(P)/FAD-dependent oxidoreductase [Agromyces sp. ISL-38]MBT2497635.1 NAD(P)/FAD-dependent oxidoreductase [Agromyces sp. ISL-38]MBT2517274.1 NAD(P)/FAD-dependent oxidoreductase [Streptomyces sp. ISL-90]